MAAPMGSHLFMYGFQYTGTGISLLSRRIALATMVMVNQHPTRERHTKHYDPKWSRQRALKFIKIELPDWHKLKQESNLEPNEMRAHLKREGILPQRTFQEREMIISCTGAVSEPYVPPEGDGKASFISGSGSKQRVVELSKKSTSYMQMRKIRQFDADFSPSKFAGQAQDIYIKAHTLLQDIVNNEDDLHDLVTERAYPEMTHHLEKKSVRWSFVESIEPPRVVHIRNSTMLSKDNIYSQVTVRLHTKQCLAIYDRFGRLMYGGESLVRDCLEYVVYEKHLSDEFSNWRIHAKGNMGWMYMDRGQLWLINVIPDWLPARDTPMRTFKKPHMPQPKEEKTESDNKQVTETDKAEGNLATA